MLRHATAKPLLAAALLPLFALSPAVPAQAAVIVITQGKAKAGNVTPGDAPGFPVTISRSGSYRLATNLTVPAGKDGISITDHDVTIDLDGFRIHGFSAANNGIVGTMHTATVRNGFVGLFRFNGISLGGDFHVIENMRIIGNASYGIYANGNSTLIRGNVVSSNGNGMFARNSLVEGNVVAGNFGVGVRAARSTVLGNTITSNASYGIFGDTVADGQQNITGYGNNTLVNNNGNGAEVFLSVAPLHPKAL